MFGGAIAVVADLLGLGVRAAVPTMAERAAMHDRHVRVMLGVDAGGLDMTVAVTMRREPGGTMVVDAMREVHAGPTIDGTCEDVPKVGE